MNTFSARVGRKRTFLSVRDVMAYEMGHRSYFAGLPAPKYDGPESTGWWDAEIEELDRRQDEIRMGVDIANHEAKNVLSTDKAANVILLVVLAVIVAIVGMWVISR